MLHTFIITDDIYNCIAAFNGWPCLVFTFWLVYWDTCL